MNMHAVVHLGVAAVVLHGAGVAAQGTARDTLRLASLQDAATRRDPRQRELSLLAAQTQLRLLDIDAQRRPSLSIESQAQYQSDVVKIPLTLPGGLTPPLPPHATYDAHLDAQQSLLDPTRNARRAETRAELAQSEAHVRSVIYGLRQSVNDAYFSALLAGTQASEVSAAMIDLEARIRAADQRESAGTALPSEAKTLRAELLKRRQDSTELEANRRAALAVLSDLTGRTIDPAEPLALPDAPAGDTSASARPEYAEFAATREHLARQEDVVASNDKPRLSAFARAGYGLPGLNFLANTFQAYWLAGVKVQWTPWNWGATSRDRESLQIQRDIVAADESAFTEGLRRAVESDRASIARLIAALASDDEIIALREDVVRETGIRLDEGVVTAADYVARESDAVNARLARAAHRVQLGQARAHYLTTLGHEVRQ